MAIPSGGGTEVLRRGSIMTLTNSDQYFTFDGGHGGSTTATTDVPDHHIITIISILVCNVHDTNAGTFTLLWDKNDGTNGVILNKTSVPAAGTFVWNDKFILHPGDQLYCHQNAATNSADIDVWYSYIDQDWS
tara:strand:- start:151 stop:549 length:399 start_codon:yes stop_codon:yes gene_type:complete